MKTNHDSNPDNEQRTIDTVLKLTLIALLLAWCAMILLPFIMPVLWGIILAVTLFPLYTQLLKVVKGKKGLSATLITLILLALLIVPSVCLYHRLSECQGIDYLRSGTYAGNASAKS